MPTPRGCFSPEGLNADSQTTPSHFISLFFLLLLAVFLAGLFHCLSVFLQVPTKTEFNTLGETQPVPKGCKIHVGEREWEGRNPATSALHLRSCNVGGQTLKFLKSMPKSIYGSQLLRASSQTVCGWFILFLATDSSITLNLPPV